MPESLKDNFVRYTYIFFGDFFATQQHRQQQQKAASSLCTYLVCWQCCLQDIGLLCDGDGGGASIAAAATTYVQQRFAVSIHENYMRLFIYESHAYNRTHTCTSPQICFEINK